MRSPMLRVWASESCWASSPRSAAVRSPCSCVGGGQRGRSGRGASEAHAAPPSPIPSSRSRVVADSPWLGRPWPGRYKRPATSPTEVWVSAPASACPSVWAPAEVADSDPARLPPAAGTRCPHRRLTRPDRAPRRGRYRRPPAPGAADRSGVAAPSKAPYPTLAGLGKLRNPTLAGTRGCRRGPADSAPPDRTRPTSGTSTRRRSLPTHRASLGGSRWEPERRSAARHGR